MERGLEMLCKEGDLFDADGLVVYTGSEDCGRGWDCGHCVRGRGRRLWFRREKIPGL